MSEADGKGQRRIVYHVDLDRRISEAYVKRLRGRGRTTRLYKRTVRLEGLTVDCWFVVTDQSDEPSVLPDEGDDEGNDNDGGVSDVAPRPYRPLDYWR